MANQRKMNPKATPATSNLRVQKSRRNQSDNKKGEKEKNTLQKKSKRNKVSEKRKRN